MIQVIVKNSKTGSQYICKSASKTVKDTAYKHISYHFVCIHNNHPFFKQFYHGPNGIQTRSELYKEIKALEKSIWNTPIHELLELTITGTRYFSVFIKEFGEISFKEVLNVFPLLPKSYLNK